MNNHSDLKISAEITPNPNTLKFVVNRAFAGGGVDFPDRKSAEESALARRLFDIAGVSGVFVGTNFVTVTKTSESDWDSLITTVVNALRALLADEAVFSFKTAETPAAAANDPVEIKIREILDHEIRPAVAMDGGDIVFVSYKEGIVTLHLRGSCSSCPSSIMTLKMGVENRLRAEIPEVKEVVQV